MYRFIERKSLKSYFSSIHFSVLFFLVLIIYFSFSLKSISEETIARQEASLQAAINRGIVSCYCVEGTYPPSLKYLVDHYGITYDKNSFFVDYQAIGSNIYPDVTIIRKVGK